MPRFEYLEANTLRQAVSMLQRHGDQARIVAGCTDFLVQWRQGTFTPRYVVNIQRIRGLSRVSYGSRNGLHLGALVKVQTLETHPVIRQHYPALSGAATAFAGLQVRNLATVGGNVCNASPAGDILPPLLAFGASCGIVSSAGKRWVPLDRFFKGPGSTALEPGEILVEFSLPPPPPNTGSLYIKHSPRGAMDIAKVGVAAFVALEDDGWVCRDVKLALGAVAPTPIRVYAAEEMLRGRALTWNLVKAAALEAQREATPIDDVRSSAAYRKAMVGVLSQQALERAIEMAQGVPTSFDLLRSLATGAVA